MLAAVQRGFGGKNEEYVAPIDIWSLFERGGEASSRTRGTVGMGQNREVEVDRQLAALLVPLPERATKPRRNRECAE